MAWQEATRLVMTCGRGCVPALCGELRALGHEPREVSATAVEVTGNLHEAMRLNLWLRTANRVLFEVAGFAVESPDELYAAMRDLPWEEWLRDDVPFHVHGVAQHETIRDSRFALLRGKDAIADRFVAQTGARPDSSASPVGAASIALYWKEGVAQLFLDTSGVPLSHRGYRQQPWVAPLRETLAASILLETGWGRNPDEAFVGPMCGSGTLAIEAAWMAQNRAPGLQRDDFAFLLWNGVAAEEWQQLRADAQRQCRTAPRTWLAASDVEPEAVACARANAARAGVESLIRLQVADFRDAGLPQPPALILLNPGYGERVGDFAGLVPLYEAIGTFFKTKCQGQRAAVLTGSPALGRKIGLHPTRRSTLWNGDIECRLLEFDIYAGTRDPRLLRKHRDTAAGAAAAPQ